MNELQYTRVLMEAVEVKMGHLECTLEEQIAEDGFFAYSEQVQEVIAHIKILEIKMHRLGQMIDALLDDDFDSAKQLYGKDKP